MPKLIRQSKKYGTFKIEFDTEDTGLVLGRTWRLFGVSKGDRYAASTRPGTRNKVDLLHRIIMQPSRGEVVDHVDGNGLNNRRSNLRVCTPVENLRNRKVIQKNNRSGFKGVCFCQKTESFKAYIWHNGKSRHLGYFNTAEEAAKAYDKAAIKFHGAFCRLNFPHDKQSAGQI